MKIMGTMVLLLVTLALGASAQTNLPPWKICRNPVRYFRDKNHQQTTVDLSPLFQWWERQPLVTTNKATADTNAAPDAAPQDDRPLTGWYRVSGTKVGTIAATWVVDAAVYTSPTIHTNARIVLYHPPTLEEENFSNIQSQIAEADRQIANAWDVYTANTNAQAIAEARVEYYRNAHIKLSVDGVRDYSALAALKEKAADAALDQVDKLEAARSNLEDQLDKIPHRGEVYQVDWFAVFLGKSKQGVPIYDLGLVSPTPP